MAFFAITANKCCAPLRDLRISSRRQAMTPRPTTNKMTTAELKDALAKLTATAEENFGKTTDGAVILDDAHHACIPDQPEVWKASAVKVEGDQVTIGCAYWDFEGVEKDEEDAGSWDWSDSDFQGQAGPYDINDEMDRKSIAYELHLA